MKKLIIIAAFLFIENTTFSQSKDEEAIKKVIMSVTNSNWESKNFDEFINNFAKSEYVVFGFTFKNKGYDSLQTMAKNYFINNTTPSGSKWEYSDWKIKLNGTSSFARCVETRTYPTGAKIKIHKANYLEKVGKEWKIIANLALTQQDEVAKDEAAINKTIIDETVAADAADYKAYMSHWSKTNKSSFLYSAGLFVGDSLWKKIDQVFATRKPVKINRERSNMNIKINGSSAFVTFEQASTNIETGNKTYSNEERYLEKINGEWKFVNVTVRANNPLFTASTMKEILDEYKNDSKAFFANRLSDDFRYPLENGKFLNKADVTTWDKGNILNTEMKDPTIFQSGDLAVVSGIHTTEHGVEKDRSPRTDKTASTYTFQRRNGKWMFVASEQLPIVDK